MADTFVLCVSSFWNGSIISFRKLCQEKFSGTYACWKRKILIFLWNHIWGYEFIPIHDQKRGKGVISMHSLFEIIIWSHESWNGIWNHSLSGRKSSRGIQAACWKWLFGIIKPCKEARQFFEFFHYVINRLLYFLIF